MFLISMIVSMVFTADYRREVRGEFEKKGYELVDFNHSCWGMIRSGLVRGNIIEYKYVEIYDDHYVLETGNVDCSLKKTQSLYQYESWNGSVEKKYDVSSGWERFEYMSLQWHFYNEICGR
jgi:hypothetical protein